MIRRLDRSRTSRAGRSATPIRVRPAARDYNLAPAVARAAVRNLTSSLTDGIPYRGTGQIHLEGMKRMIQVHRMVGAITGDVDYGKIIDTQFLPDDIKAIR